MRELTDRDILEDSIIAGMWRSCCRRRCKQQQMEGMKIGDGEEDGLNAG
jgi:hypothetical protein